MATPEFLSRPPHREPGYLAIVGAQFLGAVNDNLFKMTVSLYAATIAAAAVDAGTYLAIAGALFVLPYLLFSGYAGYLSDAFPKRRVMIVAKCCEILIMTLGLLALWSGRIEAMLAILFLMATQSAFFSPAKYGILPELFEPRSLARANGTLEMATFLAIIFGTAAGGVLFDAWAKTLQYVGAVAIAIAIIGALLSLRIAVGREPDRERPPFSWLPWREIRMGVARIAGDRPLLLAVVGISFFWFLGALIQLDVVLLGTEVMGLGGTRIGLLQAAMGLGIGGGSLAAGRLFDREYGRGLVPAGAIGIACVLAGLYAVLPHFPTTLAALVVLGFCGGLFVIPLNVIMQHRAAPHERGQIMATNNFLNMIGVLLASGALWLFRSLLNVPADELLLLVAAMTVAAAIVIAIPIARLSITGLSAAAS